MKVKPSHVLLIIVLPFLLLSVSIKAQQSNTLFYMHQVPEANYVNPAVKAPCKYFIGLPILSSIHVNAAHSGFRVNDLIANQNGNYEYTPVTAINKLGKRNYLSSELYISLLQLGFNINSYYFNFSIRERNDMNLFYSKDFFTFLLEGNTPFEGEEISLRHIDLQLNHFREFAFGVATDITPYTEAGLKFKVLFGKLNATLPNTRVGLFTEEILFHLVLSGELEANASLPIALEQQSDGSIVTNNDKYSTDPLDILFNRKNLGFAFDLGVIHQYNEDITLAASILDIGVIPYRSNQSRLTSSGNYTYTGISEGILEDESYFDDLLRQIEDSVETSVTDDNYTYVLPPKIYLGGEYNFNEKLSAGLVSSAKIYRKKIPKSLTLFGNYTIYNNIAISGSWSWMHRSINNIGFGLSLGRNPVQFYAVTDNLLGMFDPINTKNLNARVGLNIILGCRERDAEHKMISSDGCRWIDEAQRKRDRKLYKKKKSWFK